MIGIYRIRNLNNGDCYYGSSKEIEKRWKRHLNELKNNKHCNRILQRAWKKYGEENFVFEIVEECKVCMLFEVEQKYLDKKPKYNIGKNASGGDNLTNNPDKKNIIKNIKTSLKSRYSNMDDKEKKEKFSKPMEKNPNWKGGKTYIKFYCACGNEKKEGAKTCMKCRNTKGEKNPFYQKIHSKETINFLSSNAKGKYNGSQNKKILIDDVEYFSLGEASKILNIPLITIRWRILSKNPKFSNYQYKQFKKESYTIEEQLERLSKPQRHKKHNHSKPFFVDNIQYRTLKEASDSLNIHVQTIKKRLISKNFTNYNYL